MSRFGASNRFLDDQDAKKTRQSLLKILALSPRAIQFIPPALINNVKNPLRRGANVELHAEELRWLLEYQQTLGITRSTSPSKLVRLFLRAIMANRELLPEAPYLDETQLEWAEDSEPSAPKRLKKTLDGFSVEIVEAILEAATASLADR